MPSLNHKPLYRQKTFWVGVAGVVGAVAGYLTGELTFEQALTTLVGSGAIAGFRDALGKLA